ncbi:MAG TPA: FxsA family protein [Mariprofundaceae bacterium]|nr:FxsA family protein [Mariprofundaceae bacterium]
MLRLLFVLFITLPLLELYVLIKVGASIGGLATIFLCLATAAIGGLLIRWQGLNTLFRAQERISRGEVPAEHAMHGLMLVLAGILLFTPGLITDTIGFLLLVPPLRQWIIRHYIGTHPSPGDITIIEAERVDRDDPYLR